MPKGIKALIVMMVDILCSAADENIHTLVTGLERVYELYSCQRDRMLLSCNHWFQKAHKKVPVLSLTLICPNISGSRPS
jgi:hypothetical protein